METVYSNANTIFGAVLLIVLCGFLGRLVLSNKGGIGTSIFGISFIFWAVFNIVLMPHESEEQTRIVVKEHAIVDGAELRIIEIDGIDYVSSSKGAITRLVK